jgi:hypothetical protein
VLDVHEVIEVSAIFARGRLKPVSFAWKRRYYKIDEITGVYRYLTGSAKCYGYTVRCDVDFYELSLNIGDMIWRIEKVHGKG